MACSTLTIRISLCVAFLCFFGCREGGQPADTAFSKVPSSHSRVDFENRLTEDKDFNIIEYLYFYNGAGVAAGDVNNDGLPDLYFSSNQQSNKLYLNKGNFVFEDVTDRAGVAASGNWKTGVVMADVNGDGWLDIFSCGVGNYKKFNGRNHLFINNGDLTFTDKTDDYGLSFQGFSTQASFFDYDNDGDLDMYLLNHSVHSSATYGPAAARYETNPQAGDRLYRNELVPSGKPYFTDVTASAGILSSQIGYGLGVGIADVNCDGFADIYVSNDFRENDYLYLNRGDGTFRQVLEDCFPHTSKFSMGNDVGDINNDGWPDIVTLDMLPRDEAIIKTTAGDDPYDIYQYKLQFGYHPQLARNALQLNRGPMGEGELFFSDIAAFAGVEASDWSWAPLLADFDNDGFKDLFIANGIVRRPNDLDYINFIYGDSAVHLSDSEFARKMPSGAVPNMIFRNNHDLRFGDMTETWLGSERSVSTGAAYADFDNDGDLDIVTNNINAKPYLYRNDLVRKEANYLKVRLHGLRANRFGVGARVTVYADGHQFHFGQMPSRGWESSVDYLIHAGLGKSTQADSLSVIWPGGRKQTLYTVSAGRTIDLFEKDAVPKSGSPPKLRATWALTQTDDSLFRHREDAFVSFNTEKLIPHMLTTQGPKISVGDVNGDGLEDFFIGGAAGQSGALYVQTRRRGFMRPEQPAFLKDSYREDAGSAFFDANGDGSLDLFVVAGGQEFRGRDPRLMPALYLNDGKGHFARSRSSVPPVFVDASCVKPADIDNDGDLDIFIGGRVVAGQYGIDPRSYILINDGHGRFTDESRRWFSRAGYPGMVSDAEWVDVNQDSLSDLVLVGEWMPVSILVQRQGGYFINETKEYGLEDTLGWWNTLEAADLDDDGDIDLVAGNVGLNSRLRASQQEPVCVLIRDLDNNGSLDPILTYYNAGKEYPFISRDQLVRQVPAFKTKFLKYESFRNVRVTDIFQQETGYVKKSAKMFASVILQCDEQGKFLVHPLPAEAQLFPVFSMKVVDVTGDGNKDILAVGNLTAVQPDIGRYDSGCGIVLTGDGRGGFSPVEPVRSGFAVYGEGRDVQSVETPEGKIFLVGRNNDRMLVFK